MNKYINKTVVISAVATMAGMFIYKQFASNKVNQALSGGSK